jgi:hypothetical protein
MEKTIDVHKILVGKPPEQQKPETLRRRLEDIMIRKTECDGECRWNSGIGSSDFTTSEVVT